MAQQGDHYSLDEQGLWVEHVGPWATDKLKIVTDYIQASSAARRRYLGSGASYIDVFCGPGRSKIRTTGKYIDGSPVAAFKKANSEGSLTRFTDMYISDADSDLLGSAETRLSQLGAPVHPTPGPASIALPQIVKRLNTSGLHFAFLDPHNLGSLSFDLFESLATLKRIDIIVHVSLSDLQRNADRYPMALATLRAGPIELGIRFTGHFPPAIEDMFAPHVPYLARTLTGEQDYFESRAFAKSCIVECLPETRQFTLRQHPLAASDRMPVNQSTRVRRQNFLPYCPAE